MTTTDSPNPILIPASSLNVVEIQGLSKQYGRIEALKRVDLTVPAASIYGLVGPNGAGKTTLIKTLVGVLRPTSGHVRVLGVDPWQSRWELRRQIGYMPQSYALYDDLSARDNLMFFGRAFNIPRLSPKITDILGFTELTNRADDPVGTFSGGMKKRVSLACALIHDPQLLFLDEPTAAIDPELRMRFWQLFRTLAGQGKTLLISTHLMDEALLCEKVTILRAGEIIAVDTPEKIMGMGRTRLRVDRNGLSEELEIDSTPEALANALKGYGLPADVAAVSVHPSSLEEIVLALIRQQAE